eukprot:10398591-Ditylum_brightwellii.AAC.1
MDAALFKQHLRHFSQATSTHFTLDPLLGCFREYAERPLGQQLRDGTLSVDDLDVDYHTKEFLRDLQRKPTNPPTINTTIKSQDIQRNYKNWAEATSTLPS